MSLSTKERTVTKLALKRLKFGAGAFNKWRISQRRRWIQLTERNFDDWKLDGVDFTGIKLTGSSFQRASLRDALFVAANLNKVNFTGADLTNADFQGARMYETIFDSARAERVNFYSSLREGWSIRGIDCQICWIRSSRSTNSEDYEIYKPGEFEAIYGGVKIRIAFNDGFEPIDLLALPFYAKELLDKFKGKKLVFAGLSALGSPSLEFRVEDARVAVASTAEMQQYFDSRAAEIRDSVMALVIDQLSRKDQQISALHSTLKLIAEAKQEPRTMNIYNKEVKNQFNQEHGEQTQVNMLPEMAELAKELQQLIDSANANSKFRGEDKQPLVEAAAAAKANDAAGVHSALKKAGKWLLDFSKEVGLNWQPLQYKKQ